MVRRLLFLVVSLYLVDLIVTNCPPEDDLRPFCMCNYQGFLCIQSGDETDPWDIKDYFERLSPLIAEDTVFPQLKLRNTELKEIPAGTFQNFKFRNISILFNKYLDFIHPDAFGATHETTTELILSSNPRLTNDGSGHNEHDVFDVVNKFKRLQNLYLFDDSIASFPDEAFGKHPELEDLILSYDDESPANLRSIGKRVFSGLPKLVDLRLAYANISPEIIHDKAFDGIGGNVEINLKGNPISRLPKKKFKTLLDNARKVFVGGPQATMECDEESAWICKDVPKYKEVLEGFRCRYDSEFEDIFEYCEKRGKK